MKEEIDKFSIILSIITMAVIMIVGIIIFNTRDDLTYAFLNPIYIITTAVVFGVILFTYSIIKKKKKSFNCR